MSGERGLFEALRQVAATALSIFESRFELASLELSEARQRLVSTITVGLFGVLLLLVGCVSLSLCLVWLLWPQFGIAALAVMGLIYLAIGGGLLMKVRRDARNQPPLFEATHAELRRDAGMLRGPSAGPEL